MNSVGIDISKGRSTIAVMRPFGEVVIFPNQTRLRLGFDSVFVSSKLADPDKNK